LSINHHKLIGQLLLLLLVAATCALFIGGVQQKRATRCAGVHIQLSNSKHKGFADAATIANVVKTKLGRQIVGTQIEAFDLSAIESTLESNMWISNAQLYFDDNSVLHILANQRYPIARIISATNQSFYIDSNFLQLPLSQSERADLPVFTGFGNDTSKMLRTQTQSKIVSMAKYILKDSFWLAQAAQIHYEKGNFILYPAVGFHQCLLGDGSNAVDKLERLKWFYQGTAATYGFDNWAKLSAEFNGQILAIRHIDSLPEKVDEKKAAEVFAQLVKNNKQMAADADNSAASERKFRLAKSTIKPAEKYNPPTSPTNSQENLPVPKAVMPKKNNH
jgi:cell division protein FtsQ